MPLRRKRMRCPLMALSGREPIVSSGLVLTGKRTCLVSMWVSASDPKQTFAVRSDQATATTTMRSNGYLPSARGRPPLVDLIALARVGAEVFVEFVGHVHKGVGIGWCRLLPRDVGPNFRVLAVDVEPLFETGLCVWLDCVDRAFRLANAAIDAFSPVAGARVWHGPGLEDVPGCHPQSPTRIHPLPPFASRSPHASDARGRSRLPSDSPFAPLESCEGLVKRWWCRT